MCITRVCLIYKHFSEQIVIKLTQRGIKLPGIINTIFILDIFYILKYCKSVYYKFVNITVFA